MLYNPWMSFILMYYGDISQCHKSFRKYLNRDSSIWNFEKSPLRIPAISNLIIIGFSVQKEWWERGQEDADDLHET